MTIAEELRKAACALYRMGLKSGRPNRAEIIELADKLYDLGAEVGPVEWRDRAAREGRAGITHEPSTYVASSYVEDSDWDRPPARPLSLVGKLRSRAALCLLPMMILASAPWPSEAAATMPCHNATEIAKQLSNKYDEAPVAFGLQSNGNLLQVYASEEKGTWTVVSTTPAGMSCIVAAGKHWGSLPVIKGEPL